MLPFFMYLTYPRGQGPAAALRTDPGLAGRHHRDHRGNGERQRHAADQDLRSSAGQPINRFRDANAKLAKLQIRQSMVGRWFFMIVGTVFSITPALVYWLAGYLSISGAPSAPTIGDIVAFTTLQSRLFFPLGQLLNVQVEVQGALALFDRIFEYLDLPVEIADAPDAVDPGAGQRYAARSASVTFRSGIGRRHRSRSSTPLRPWRRAATATRRARHHGTSSRHLLAPPCPQCPRPARPEPAGYRRARRACRRSYGIGSAARRWPRGRRRTPRPLISMPRTRS